MVFSTGKYSQQGLVWCLLIFSLTVKNNIVTCAPTNTRDTDHATESVPSTSAQSGHLAYATFHADLRIINLAADVTSRIPRKFYLKNCTEKEYLDWYINEYPPDCQFGFSNATSLMDLLKVYCDPVCGDTYLSYIETCGETAVEMAHYYRRLCARKGNQTFVNNVKV